MPTGRLPILLLPGPARAWSDLGHRIIYEIAFQELNDTARDRVKAMIERDPEFDTFAESCAWPDHPRQRATEHYVNLPRDSEGLDQDPCPLADECVVSAIDRDLAVLSSSSASEQQQLESLKYLGHWVGDVHQPLHVSFQDDRGGNNVGISGGICSWDLHAVWDRCLIEHGLPGDPYTSHGTFSARSLTKSARRGWRPPRSTARTSPSRSRSAPRSNTASATNAGCWYDADNERLDPGEPERTVTIDQSYIDAHTPTVGEQLVKAGVRLAELLDRALGD